MYKGLVNLSVANKNSLERMSSCTVAASSGSNV